MHRRRMGRRFRELKTCDRLPMKKEIIVQEGQSTCWVIRGAFDRKSLVHWTESIPWQQNNIRIYGKTHPEPRLTAWMGPAYRYSSIKWPATPFTAEAQEFVTEVESHIQTARLLQRVLIQSLPQRGRLHGMAPRQRTRN